MSGIDTAAATRVAEVAAEVVSKGPEGVDPALFDTDERIVAVQVITPDGTVVRRSASAPATPLIAITEFGDGLHIGMPEHTSPFGRIRFTAQTVDGRDGRHTVRCSESACQGCQR